MKLEKQKHWWALVRPAKWETANPNGRPKKLLSSLLAELRDAGYQSVKPVNVIEAYELLFWLDESQIKIIAEDLERPMIVRIVAKSMTREEGTLQVLETMLDRVHGRPTQKVVEEIKGEMTISENKKPILSALLWMRKKS